VKSREEMARVSVRMVEAAREGKGKEDASGGIVSLSFAKCSSHEVMRRHMKTRPSSTRAHGFAID
jgi:hypothetical protein